MTVASRLFTLIAFIAIATPARAADDPRLIPKPREITVGELIPLSRIVSLDGIGNEDDRFAAREFAESLTDRGIRATLSGGGGYRISLLRTTSPEAKSILADRDLALKDAMIAEGYVLVVGKNETHVIGATASGIFYGLQTLKQLIRTDGATPQIRLATIRDWPALNYRGFQDDLSRGPLPTLEFQKKQIRLFAAYKLNTFSPYFEQTLAYASTPLVAPPGGSMSREDVKTLVAYAKKYHIDVIPQQEAFGHLHHVLKYDIYAALGETDHGHVLAPGDPGSLPRKRSAG